MYEGFDADEPDLNMAAIPLGDLQAGTHTISLNLSVGTLNYSVVTYDGDMIESTVSEDGSVSFMLSKDTEAVSLIGTTTDKDIELQYQLQPRMTSGAAHVRGPPRRDLLYVFSMSVLAVSKVLPMP